MTATHPLDPTTQFAALQERVHGLGQQVLHFEQATGRSFQQVETALAALSAELRAGGKTQWQTIVTSVGVLVAILGSLGALAYLPVRNSMEQLGGETRILRESIVPRAEHVDRWRRIERDIELAEAAIARNADRIVPRAEHEQRWRSAEQIFAEHQRQIDDVRRLVISGPGSRSAPSP